MHEDDDVLAHPRSRPAPWVLDGLLGVGVALVVSLFIAADIEHSEPEGWAYLWAVVLGGLMLVRRRHPVIVLVLSLAAVLSYYAAGFPSIGVAVPLAAAVFSAAESGRTVSSIAASTTMIVISVAYRLGTGQDPAFVVGYELPGHVLLLAGAVALGDSLRSRRELRRQADRIAELVAERISREAAERALSERLAIARDLHDSVGHALTVVTLHRQIIEDALGSDDDAVRRSLDVIAETTATSFTELRTTVASLRRGDRAQRAPLRLTELAAAALPAQQAGLVVRTAVRVPRDLPPTIEEAVYRIVQESLTNVVRHARATRVDVEVTEVDGALLVSILDDGAAPPHEPASRASPSGSGLPGMRERVQLLGGTLTAAREDAGFAVRATIPLEVGHDDDHPRR